MESTGALIIHIFVDSASASGVLHYRIIALHYRMGALHCRIMCLQVIIDEPS
jgi:hypothetical protein